MNTLPTTQQIEEAIKYVSKGADANDIYFDGASVRILRNLARSVLSAMKDGSVPPEKTNPCDMNEAQLQEVFNEARSQFIPLLMKYNNDRAMAEKYSTELEHKLMERDREIEEWKAKYRQQDYDALEAIAAMQSEIAKLQSQLASAQERIKELEALYKNSLENFEQAIVDLAIANTKVKELEAIAERVKNINVEDIYNVFHKSEHCTRVNCPDCMKSAEAIKQWLLGEEGKTK